MRSILIFVSNYFPGYRSGGIARTVLNTVEWLGNDFEFLIVTRDRDLGSDKPYERIPHGVWVPLGASKVRYLAPDELTFRALAQLVNDTKHDILHLNSFFDSVFTIKLLLLIRMRWIHSPKIIMSPRGEFVEGPLNIKYKKKKTYILLSRIVGLYKDIKWHASSSHELEGIVKALGVCSSAVYSAIDLPIKDSGSMSTEVPQGNELKIVFLSRLTREKNLDGALRILQLVRQPMQFDIVGPKQDIDYWRECEALLVQLPRHVKSRYLGPISPEDVFACLTKYDVFLFPTHGENYGHVIAESISVGTRVLISQGTPWRNLVEDGVGWDLDVEDHAEFAKVLDDLAQQPYEERIALRDSVRRSASMRLYNPEALDHNRVLYS